MDTCSVCLAENSQLILVGSLYFPDIIIQRFHLRLWMEICDECVQMIGQFVTERRYTWRDFWQDYYVMEAEERWREFEDLGTEFWSLIHEFFDEEDNMH